MFLKRKIRKILKIKNPSLLLIERGTITGWNESGAIYSSARQKICDYSIYRFSGSEDERGLKYPELTIGSERVSTKSWKRRDIFDVLLYIFPNIKIDYYN